MPSFDPDSPLDARELDYISKQLNSRNFMVLSRNLCIRTPLKDLARQYKGNAVRREMLFTWHNNQVPAKERKLMVRALNESNLGILAGIVLFGDQHHATGNSGASNLNMGMASFDPIDRPLDARELDHISDHLDSIDFLILRQNLGMETPAEDWVLLVRQHNENADAPREMLKTWHSYQDPAKGRRLLIEALIESSLCILAEIVQMGGCHTVPQGMSTDQHHATGNAVASNWNMGMASFNPDTPLDALELSYISEQLGPYDWRKLGLYLGITETRLANWERQYMMNIEQAASQMLYTWHNNQHPSQERKLLIEALEKTKLRSLGEKVRMGECRRTVPQGMRPIPPEPFNHHQHPTPPAARCEPIAVANLLQQPDIVPMQMTQQTSYEITEIKLRDVSNKLGAEWRTVGTYLGFNNSQVEVMQEEYRVVIKECIFQMLLQWRNCNGVEATKEKLKRVLRRSNREDLVDFIDEADD